MAAPAIVSAIVSGIAASTAARLLDAHLDHGSRTVREPNQRRKTVDEDDVAGDEIYLVSGDDDDDDEVGAKRKRKARTAKGRPAHRRKAMLPSTSIAAAATVHITPTLNSSFKAIGMRMSGTDVGNLVFNGATIRGRPQEASAGSVGCAIFTQPGEEFYEEWDTASPGEAFTLSFTNPTAGPITLRGYLIGYMAG